MYIFIKFLLKKIIPLIYFFLLVYATFFTKRRFSHIDYRSKANLNIFNDWVSINTFNKMTYLHKYSYLENIIGNLLMFIPMVFAVFLLFDKEIKTFIMLLALLLTSVFIEILQYEFNLGVFDINDILLNFVGGLIGLLAFKAMKFKAWKISFISRFCGN